MNYIASSFARTASRSMIVLITRRRSIVALSLLLGATASPLVSQEVPGEFRSVKLPEGVALDVPTSFTLLDQQGRELQSLYGAAVLDLSDIPRGSGGVLFAARSEPSRSGWAEVIVAVQYALSAGQDDVEALSASEISLIDQQMQADIQASGEVTGAKIISWSGSQKVRLGSVWSLVTRYTYFMPGDPGPREMISHRIFLGDRNIGILLQHSQENGGVWSVILRRIDSSIRVDP